MKLKFFLERIERYCTTGEKEDFPACPICSRFIGTTQGCSVCNAYNECVTDKLVTDLAAGHLCEQHQEHCAKFRRAAKVELRKSDKRNRRDRTKIHWPPNFRLARRSPCHHIRYPYINKEER